MRWKLSKHDVAKNNATAKDIGVLKSSEGRGFAIKEFDANAKIVCNKDCFYAKHEDMECHLKRCLNIPMGQNSFKCIKALVNFKSSSSSNEWIIDHRDIILQDTDGYSYEGHILCEELLGPREVKEDYNVMPGTQVDYVQLYPSLPDGALPSTLIAKVSRNNSLRFMVGDPVVGMPDLDEYNDMGPSGVSDIRVSLKLERIEEKLRNLKTKIFSRLNADTLDSKQASKLEEEINTAAYSLSLDVENTDNLSYLRIKNELDQIMSDYRFDLQKKNAEEKIVFQSVGKVEELLELSPRDFELFVAGMLKDLRYVNVCTTQYVNDQGIDIFAEKGGERFVVQCKRYKGTVGSPEIQTFLGAMVNARADKGIFITTGMFTYEAQKMAYGNPIILVNKFDLARWLEIAIAAKANEDIDNTPATDLDMPEYLF